MLLHRHGGARGGAHERRLGRAGLGARRIRLPVRVPILCLIVFSFTAGEITTRLDGLSLRWYAALARDVELHAVVLLSLRVGALAATAAVVVGTNPR